MPSTTPRLSATGASLTGLPRFRRVPFDSVPSCLTGGRDVTAFRLHMSGTRRNSFIYETDGLQCCRVGLETLQGLQLRSNGWQ